MRRRRVRESDLYPRVERWMRKHFVCFKSAINLGLSYSRVDVLGVRDVGGDLSGEIETIAIEVKNGREPFATASGQAAGYQVYANRVYLAERRPERFNSNHIAIASQLGIGLIWIRDAAISEVLTSPYRAPIPRLSLALMERMALGRCQLCSTFFQIGKDKSHKWSNLARENVRRAFDNEKGLMFWNREMSLRKRRMGIESRDGSTFERRYICSDCVQYVLGDLAGHAE